ncbi:hypothetical protein MPTK2_4g02510 [Marchantia polymorpha subsp. ruderalis]
MQAYRLRIADGHHTQVVKVCVEPRSNCAAFVLADSSCLLLSLASLPAIQPTPIPAPCTDACFLRLQARVLAGGGSLPPSSSSSSSSSSRAHPHPGPVVVDRIAPGGASGASRLPPNGNGKGAGASSTRSRVFFLTSQPARGGSCVDLSAWLCEAPSFARTGVELDRSRKSSHEIGNPGHDLPRRPLSSRCRAARLEIPHGMVLKMAASVNVVIVYSISVGKIWILAAKHVVASGTAAAASPSEFHKDQGSRPLRGGGGAGAGASSTGLGTVEKDLELGMISKRDGDGPGHLLLMKCAVLECNRPLYSMCVSPQHLLLGEAGGVRIWPLRPLIKPDKRLKEREQRAKDSSIIRSDDSRVHASGLSKIPHVDAASRDHSTHLGVGKSSNGEVRSATCASGCKPQDWALNGATNEGQRVEDQQLDSLAFKAEIVDIKPVPKNGLYALKGDGKEQAGAPTCGVPPRNGFHEKEKKVCLVVNTKCFGNGFISELDSRLNVSSREANGHEQDGEGQAVANTICGPPLTLGISSKNELQKVLSMCENHVGAVGKEDPTNAPAIAHQFKVDADHMGKRAIMESLWKAGGVQKRNGVVLQNGNGHELLYNVEASQSFSSGSEGVGCLETSTPSEDSHQSDDKLLDHVKQQPGLGFVGPMFVTTCKESQQDGFMAGKGVLQAQVVDIQEISLRKFVVLDSSGELHLLVLEDVQDRGTNSPLRVSHPKMTRLHTSMKVCSMAVLLPAVQSSSVEAKRGVVRKLWISDGRYSNYVAIVPSDGPEEVQSETRTADSERTAALPVRVAQTVFLSERVAALAAVSPETVLVVTQGSITAYVISGS